MDKESNNYYSTAAISDSPAKSSSVCSSPLPFSALSPITTCSGGPKNFSIEEVWRDISVSSLHRSSNRSTSASATTTCLALQGSSIQDFLSRSPPNRKQRSRAGHGGQPYPIAESDSAFEAPRVVPLLRLSTSTEIHCVERSRDHSSVKSQQLRTVHDATGKAPCSFSLSRLSPPHYSSTVEFPILRKKRIPESDDNNSDHRNKRMMKNRESASRSRARQQAYTTGLELEVSRLMEENGRLRRQLEKLCTAAAPVQCPKRHMLRRTLTAPF